MLECQLISHRHVCFSRYFIKSCLQIDQSTECILSTVQHKEKVSKCELFRYWYDDNFFMYWSKHCIFNKQIHRIYIPHKKIKFDQESLKKKYFLPNICRVFWKPKHHTRMNRPNAFSPLFCSTERNFRFKQPSSQPLAHQWSHWGTLDDSEWVSAWV